MNTSKGSDTPSETSKLLNGEVALHEYDGIAELDNPMPRWWLMLFYFGIAFGAVYFAYYELGSGQTIRQEFGAQLTQIESQQTQSKGTGPDEVALLAAFHSDESKKKGRAVFSTKCASCHGPEGQGGIGPNLTDAYWLHGAKIAEIARTISEGVLDKGMPPWGAVLSKEEVIQVAAYVKSLGGTHPSQPKSPQGTLVKE